MSLQAILTSVFGPAALTIAAAVWGGWKLWRLIERRLDNLDHTIDSRFTASEGEIALIKGALSQMDGKFCTDNDRLNSIEECIYYVLDGVVQNGANGPVKRYRDAIAASGRWCPPEH